MVNSFGPLASMTRFTCFLILSLEGVVCVRVCLPHLHLLLPNIGGVTVRLYEARLWWEYGGVQYNTEIHVYSTLCPQ